MKERHGFLGYVSSGVLIAILLLAQGSAASSQTIPAVGEASGDFVRTVWAGLQGNGFRVNAPEIPEWAQERWEGQQTGLMKIHVDADPSEYPKAELYLELWGGHPGTARKRFTLNDKRVYMLPEVGAAKENCTYSYPLVPINPSDMKQGENQIQFTCDGTNTFWGHYLIRAACFRLHLKNDHQLIDKAGLKGFACAVNAKPLPDDQEKIELSLAIPPAFSNKISRIEYMEYYRGYDENGNRLDTDWHGFTKDRTPVGIVASVSEAPFRAEWDLSMIPDQEKIAVRARVFFKDSPDLTYETPALSELPVPKRKVTLHYSHNLPVPFWSRVGRVKKCTINLDFDPATIEQAKLHVVIWDGGKGNTAEPFTLNGRPLAVAGGGKHDVLYRVLTIDPKILRKGDNEIRLLSDTEHHGIEILLPGPALIVRTIYRVRATNVFYNNSGFDGNDAAANAADDGAIAPDKTALLPGGTATFANYTSYSRGINGIMVDIANLPGTPTKSDFVFKVGNDDNPAAWTTASAPAGVTVRKGAGVGGSDRITLIWADNAIQKQWLQVTVKATAATGLTAADVFYFGNAIGETGNSTADATVNYTDETDARGHPHSFGGLEGPAGIDDTYDFNRDKKVGPTDEIIARSNGTNSTTALRLIAVP